MRNEDYKYLITRNKIKSFLLFESLCANKLLTSKTPEFHKEIIDYYLTKTKCTVAAPRSHSKTTLTSLYCLWQLFTRVNFAVWVGSRFTNANEVTASLLEILYNEDLNKLFNIQILSKSVQRLEFSVDGVKKAFHSDGIFGNLRGLQYLGQRPDIVVVDDAENDINTTSGEQRKKLDRIYKSMVLSLGHANTQYIVIGTILHFDSLLNNLLKEGGLIFRTNPEKPLWEDRFNTEWLKGKRQELGSLIFAQEYENIPTALEDAIIKPEWIKYGSADNTFDVVSIDPAISKSDTADNTGFLIVGSKEGKFYVKEDMTAKYTPYELAKKVIDYYKVNRFNTKAILVEDVAYQKALKDIIIVEGAKQGLALPVQAIKVDMDKERRLKVVSPFFENGQVYFEKHFDELRTELVQFPAGLHDDRVDSLSMSLSFLKNAMYQTVKTEVYNRESFLDMQF